MKVLVCQTCGELNSSDAQTCKECGASLQDAEPAVVPDAIPVKWWRLDTIRTKLKAIGVVVGLAWLFSPIGGLRMIIALVDALARGPLQTDFLHIAGGVLGLTAIGVLLFPSGLTGFAPGLEKLLPGGTGIAGIGWLLYIGLVAAFLVSRRRLLVRVIFLVFVLLIVWNTAGCYPALQHFN